MLIILGQYLIRFPVHFIERFRRLEKLKKDYRITMEKGEMLEFFKGFQSVNLDNFIGELYYALDQLCQPEAHDSAFRLKLQEMMITSADAKRPLFTCSFNTVTVGS